jgi:hypothetical protein
MTGTYNFFIFTLFFENLNTFTYTTFTYRMKMYINIKIYVMEVFFIITKL